MSLLSCLISRSLCARLNPHQNKTNEEKQRMYTTFIEIVESSQNLKIKMLKMWLKPKGPENAEKTLTKPQNRKKDPEDESMYFFP